MAILYDVCLSQTLVPKDSLLKLAEEGNLAAAAAAATGEYLTL